MIFAMVRYCGAEEFQNFRFLNRIMTTATIIRAITMAATIMYSVSRLFTDVVVELKMFVSIMLYE
jgi:hypothetical protein